MVDCRTSLEAPPQQELTSGLLCQLRCPPPPSSVPTTHLCRPLPYPRRPAALKIITCINHLQNHHDQACILVHVRVGVNTTENEFSVFMKSKVALRQCFEIICQLLSKSATLS